MYGYLKNYPDQIPFLCGEGAQLATARWVRMPQSEYTRLGITERPEIEDAYFALRTNIDAVPDTVKVEVSAVNRYRLYVNGISCAFGPRKGDQYSWYYETVDIAPLLKAGENVIAAYVLSATPKAQQMGPGKVVSAASVVSGLDVIALVLNGHIGETDISTGVADWRVRRDIAKIHRYYPPCDAHGSFETLDTSKLPEDWLTDPPVFADWVQAERLFKPGCNYYGQMRALPLMPRPFAQMTETPIDFAGQIAPSEGAAFRFDDTGKAGFPARSQAACVLDAGAHTTAFIRTAFEGAGAKVRFTYAEAFQLKNAQGELYKERRDDERGIITGPYDEIITCPSGSYEPFWFRTFRYVLVEVETGDTPLTLHCPALRRAGYPLKVETKVQSSSEDINWLWDRSLRTLRNSTHENFSDGPFYEQLPYIMDSTLELNFIYALSQDTAFPAAILWDFHSSLRPDGMLCCSYPSNEVQVIPGFSLQFVWMVERNYHHTGDKRIAAFYRPTIDATLAYFDRHIGADGLCEGLGYWEFADWSKQWNGCHGRPDAIEHGPSTLFNLMYAYTLQLAARLNRVTGRPGMAQEYTDRAGAILRALDSLCWDKDREMLCEGPGFAQFSQHSQVLGVLTGLLTDARGRTALTNMLADTDVVECSLPWRYYLFRALERYSLYDPMRERLDNLAMLRKFNFTTMPEWGFEGSRSDCHGWSATALYELPATVLGVRPAEDGWTKILVHPIPMGYPDCRGTVITPKGPVHVSWSVKNDEMQLELDTPHDTIVVMPDTRHYRVQAGHYSFSATMACIFSVPSNE